MQHSDMSKLPGQIVDPALKCSELEKLETFEYSYTCCTMRCLGVVRFLSVSYRLFFYHSKVFNHSTV